MWAHRIIECTWRETSHARSDPDHRHEWRQVRWKKRLPEVTEVDGAIAHRCHLTEVMFEFGLWMTNARMYVKLVLWPNCDQFMLYICWPILKHRYLSVLIFFSDRKIILSSKHINYNSSAEITARDWSLCPSLATMGIVQFWLMRSIYSLLSRFPSWLTITFINLSSSSLFSHSNSSKRADHFV